MALTLEQLQDEAYRHGFVQGFIRTYRNYRKQVDITLSLGYKNSTWASFHDRFKASILSLPEHQRKLLPFWNAGLDDGQTAASLRMAGRTNEAVEIEARLRGIEQQLGPANDHVAPPSPPYQPAARPAVPSHADMDGLYKKAYRHGFANGYIKQCHGYGKPCDIYAGLNASTSEYSQFMRAHVQPVAGLKDFQIKRIRNHYNHAKDDGHAAASYRMAGNENKARELEAKLKRETGIDAANDNAPSSRGRG